MIKKLIQTILKTCPEYKAGFCDVNGLVNPDFIIGRDEPTFYLVGDEEYDIESSAQEITKTTEIKFYSFNRLHDNVMLSDYFLYQSFQNILEYEISKMRLDSYKEYKEFADEDLKDSGLYVFSVDLVNVIEIFDKNDICNTNKLCK